MTKQEIESVFSKFKDVFVGRQEDIMSFLLKYSDNLLKGREIIDIKRIDSTEELNKSGFRKNISSWSDPEGNPILSTCLEIDDVQKRFDYIFYLKQELIKKEKVEVKKKKKEVKKKKEEIKEEKEVIKEEKEVIKEEKEVIKEEKEVIKEEKEVIEEERGLIEEDREAIEEEKEIIKEPEIDTTLIEKVDYSEITKDLANIFEDSIKFMHSFQFEQAIIQLDSMIELLLERDLSEYTKKLQEKRDYLKAAQEIYSKRHEELVEINKKIAEITQGNVLIKDNQQFQDTISKINALMEELQEKALPGYIRILEDKKQEIIAAQEIYNKMKEELGDKGVVAESVPDEKSQIQTLKDLERMIKINREYNQYEAAEVNIGKMIEILKDMNRNDLVQKYYLELEYIKKQKQYSNGYF